MKKLTTIISIAFLSIMTFNCNNDDDPKFKEIDAVTGIKMVDENGGSLGVWGIPNEKASSISVFPIPAKSIFIIESELPLKNIWIISGACETDDLDTDISELSLAIDYQISEIEELQLINIPSTEINGNSIAVDVSDLQEGIYRIFFETESNEVYWKNVFKLNNEFGDFSPSKLIEYLDDECQ